MRRIDRVLSRHRRLTAVAGVLILMGVASLNVHAALPEHHDGHRDGATMCFATLSIAVLAAFAWRPKRMDGPAPRRLRLPLVRIVARMALEPPPPAARAGPPWTAVLRR